MNSKQEAEQDAEYFWHLINICNVPQEIAARMATARVHARVTARETVDARRPPPEPWQQ